MLRALSLTALLSAAALLHAESNIRPGSEFAWSPNSGWINWRANGSDGAVIGRYILSGFIYSANLGWISLGSGAPRSGIQYQNDSGGDFGVNADASGRLSGLAYGANFGWIHLGSEGDPRLDLKTGLLSGSMYAANLGWIELSGASFAVAVDQIDPGLDSDRDGIPDAYELAVAGSLGVLGALGDADGDGQNDRDEYLAGTDPLDERDVLRIVDASVQNGAFVLEWPVRLNREYVLQQRTSIAGPESWENVPFEMLSAQTGLMKARLIDPLAAKTFLRVQARLPLSGP